MNGLQSEWEMERDPLISPMYWISNQLQRLSGEWVQVQGHEQQQQQPHIGEWEGGS